MTEDLKSLYWQIIANQNVVGRVELRPNGDLIIDIVQSEPKETCVPATYTLRNNAREH